MLSKKNRLKEREVKKVLQKWKPFFSQDIVANILVHKWNEHRFAIVLSWKSVRNSVERNFFRRIFYRIMQEVAQSYVWVQKYDCVFVVKKQMKLIQNDEKSVANFKKDIHFLLEKKLATTLNR